MYTWTCILLLFGSEKWKSLSRLFEAPWTILFWPGEFSRPEYWSGQPFPSPGDLPNPGIERRPPYCRRILNQLSHKGSPKVLWKWYVWSRINELSWKTLLDRTCCSLYSEVQGTIKICIWFRYLDHPQENIFKGSKPEGSKTNQHYYSG